MSDLLQAAGVRLCDTAADCAEAGEPRTMGATLLVELGYQNLVPWSEWGSKFAYADEMNYVYKVTALDDGAGAAPSKVRSQAAPVRRLGRVCRWSFRRCPLLRRPAASPAVGSPESVCRLRPSSS